MTVVFADKETLFVGTLSGKPGTLKGKMYQNKTLAKYFLSVSANSYLLRSFAKDISPASIGEFELKQGGSTAADGLIAAKMAPGDLTTSLIKKDLKLEAVWRGTMKAGGEEIKYSAIFDNVVTKADGILWGTGAHFTGEDKDMAESLASVNMATTKEKGGLTVSFADAETMIQGVLSTDGSTIKGSVYQSAKAAATLSAAKGAKPEGTFELKKDMSAGAAKKLKAKCNGGC